MREAARIIHVRNGPLSVGHKIVMTGSATGVFFCETCGIGFGVGAIEPSADRSNLVKVEPVEEKRDA